MEFVLPKCTIALAFLWSLQLCHVECYVNHDVTLLLDDLLKGYDKNIRPGHGKKGIIVETDIHIRSMGPMSEESMEYSMQCYFRQRWYDERLKFNLGNITEFTLNNKFVQNIWKPNTFFLNGRRSQQHNITVPNMFVRLKRDGSIYMSRRLTISATCPMKLSWYPMDKQVCPLQIGSYGYTQEELKYIWKYGNQKSVDLHKSVTMAQFEIGEIEGKNLTMRNNFGEFSILEVFIQLDRSLGYFLIQTYLPCYLIVGLSWVSFWINRDAAPARVLLGVTTILSTAAIGITIREGLPRVPYATALDVFLNVCLVYDMAALIEYAFVNYFTKLIPKEGGKDEEEETAALLPKKHNASTPPGANGEPEIEAFIDADTFKEDKTYTDACYRMFWRCLIGNFKYRHRKVNGADVDIGNSVSQIDIFSRYVFPSSFVVFNVLYWILYFGQR